MSANLEQIIQISKEDFSILVSGGTITKSGVTYTYDENTLYLVDSDIEASTWGKITGELSAQTDLQQILDSKQATLVSGTNIKTINGQTILGSGNIEIQGGGTGITYVAGENITITDSGDTKVISAKDTVYTAGNGIEITSANTINCNVTGSTPYDDTWVRSAISGITTALTENATAISAETTARETGDINLHAEVTAETLNRQTEDTAIWAALTAETATRISGDTKLQGNIDAEATARSSADTALGTRIDGKQDELTAGDNITISGVTISAKDTVYTAGSGITIDESNVISSNIEIINLL